MKAAIAIVVFVLIMVRVFLPIVQLLLVKSQQQNRIEMIRPLNRYDVLCKRDMP